MVLLCINDTDSKMRMKSSERYKRYWLHAELIRYLEIAEKRWDIRWVAPGSWHICKELLASVSKFCCSEHRWWPAHYSHHKRVLLWRSGTKSKFAWGVHLNAWICMPCKHITIFHQLANFVNYNSYVDLMMNKILTDSVGLCSKGS